MKQIWKISLLLALVAGVSVGSVWAYTSGPKSFRIRRGVRKELLLQLPKSTKIGGQSFALEDVEINNFTEGSAGCAMDLQIVWSGEMRTWTGMVMQADGYGRYVGNLNIDGRFI